MDLRLKKIILLALLTAFTCVATMVIRIPSPTGGYVNLGDCIILLSGWLLGPWYGAVAGAVGSALADLFSGYAVYIPGTFVIKGLVGLIGGLLFNVLAKKIKPYLSRIISALTAEIWMCVGYFAYTSLLLGKGLGALASVPGNLVQGGVCIIIGLLLIQIFTKTGLDKRLI